MALIRHFEDRAAELFQQGNLTGLIGDPTGRSATRKPLTREELERNAETYNLFS